MYNFSIYNNHNNYPYFFHNIFLIDFCLFHNYYLTYIYSTNHYLLDNNLHIL